jgi:hypothetical protein
MLARVNLSEASLPYLLVYNELAYELATDLGPPVR